MCYEYVSMRATVFEIKMEFESRECKSLTFNISILTRIPWLSCLISNLALSHNKYQWLLPCYYQETCYWQSKLYWKSNMLSVNTSYLQLLYVWYWWIMEESKRSWWHATRTDTPNEWYINLYNWCDICLSYLFSSSGPKVQICLWLILHHTLNWNYSWHILE